MILDSLFSEHLQLFFSHDVFRRSDEVFGFVCYVDFRKS